MNPADDRGPPAGIAEPKRPAANVPLRVDLHDFLVNRRLLGMAVAVGYRFRFERAKSTGLQYRCTTAGVTGHEASDRIKWPSLPAVTLQDGSVVWTSEAIDTNSLRASVSSSVWSADTGLSLSSPSVSDLVYSTFAAGGLDGRDYDVRHTATLNTGEIVESLINLPIKD